MQTATANLTGAALDWAVCMALGMKPEDLYISQMGKYTSIYQRTRDEDDNLDGRYQTGPDLIFHRKWEAGGPIIEREGINLDYDREWVYDPALQEPDDEPDNGDRWLAEYRVRGDQCVSAYGPTPLIAAMRCFVTSKLGEITDVPEKLMK